MLILLGTLMIVSFVVLTITKRLTAVTALILLPIIFGLLADPRADLGGMAMEGIIELAPIATLLVFAVLYFAIMFDAGLFDPLVIRAVRFGGNDPRRVAVSTAVVVVLVSLDGDGATTALVTISTFLPIYKRLGMNPLILAFILGGGNGIVNLTPWGGPTGRVVAALNLDPLDVFLPLLPSMIVGMGAVIVIAWYMGNSERKRLGYTESTAGEAITGLPFEREEGVARPHLFYFNLVLTLATVACAFLQILPMPLVFMIALAIALVVNYRDVASQRQRLAVHAPNALPIGLLILAAGIFTGVMNGTGMIDAMAKGAVTQVPERLGPWLGWITAFMSGPLTFALPNDSYYFGVVPVIAQTAAEFDIPPVVIARASLLGQPIHSMSPLIAAIYLVSGLLGCDVGEMQRFALKWAILLTLILIAVALLTGAIY